MDDDKIFVIKYVRKIFQQAGISKKSIDDGEHLLKQNLGNKVLLLYVGSGY